MNGYQIYNLTWLIVWVLLGIGGAYGIYMGNVAHFVTLGASIYFAALSWLDKENGESLKDLTVKLVKQYTEKK